MVLGQRNFHQNGEYTDATASTFYLAYSGIARDAVGNFYVADTWYCRVLEFQAPLSTDMSASVVIGQPQFTGVVKPTCATGGANGMMDPVGVAVDSQGDLWVSDHVADRVTEYVPPFTNGMAATLAIGQGNLQDTVCNGTSARTLCSPEGIAFDAEGDLWVADLAHYRVLEFVPPFSTGMAASLELGQPAATAFTSANPPSNPPVWTVTAAKICGPAAIAFDRGGDLWVADSSCNRVLEFVPPFTNGMAASVVLGQPNFSLDAPYEPTASSLGDPLGLSFDSNGDLIVSSNFGFRALVFVPPFRTGMNATVALGQPNLTTGSWRAPTDSTLSYPAGVLAW